jgi:hypothetical protein
MKIKIYIEADFDNDVPTELHDEQIMHGIVNDNVQLLCRELGLDDVALTTFDVIYDEEG